MTTKLKECHSTKSSYSTVDHIHGALTESMRDGLVEGDEMRTIVDDRVPGISKDIGDNGEEQAQTLASRQSVSSTYHLHVKLPNPSNAMTKEIT